MSHPNIKSGDIINRNFQIQKKIGEGQSAYVYKAILNNIEYALKVFFENDDARELFTNELKINNKLLASRDVNDERYKYICLSNDYFCHMIVGKNIHMYPVISYPYCECDLFAYMDKYETGLSIADTKKFLRQIALGLSVFHQNNIVHTDLKPENLLVVYENQAPILKIVDVGTATESKKSQKTRSVGTYSYNAVELVLGMDFDLPVDIWSLGCIIFELYTGDKLFHTSHPDDSSESDFSESESESVPDLVENLDIDENTEKPDPQGVHGFYNTEKSGNGENVVDSDDKMTVEESEHSDCSSCSDDSAEGHYFKIFNKVNYLLASYRLILGDIPREIAKAHQKYFTKTGGYKQDYDDGKKTNKNELYNALFDAKHSAEESKYVESLIRKCINYYPEKRIKIDKLIELLDSIEVEAPKNKSPSVNNQKMANNQNKQNNKNKKK